MNCTASVTVILAVLFAAGAGAEDRAPSGTTLGADANLSAGAEALRAGDFAEGIRLSLRGLPRADSTRQRAAALSNLCAGYAATEQFAEAVDYCDQSLKLNPRLWKARANRAHALLGSGRVEEAVSDIEVGLEIAPESATLKRLQAVAQSMQRKPHVIMEQFP